MINEIAAQKLKALAQLTELDEQPWQSRAYDDASKRVKQLSKDIDTVYEEHGKNGLTAIPDIGDAIADKLIQFIETGRVDALQALKHDYPSDIDDILSIRGLGPATIRTILDELDISSYDALKKAAENGELETVRGVGPKTVQRIKNHERRAKNELRLDKADQIIRSVASWLDRCDAVKQVTTVGDRRRNLETVNNVRLAVATTEPETCAQHVQNYRFLVDLLDQDENHTLFTIAPDKNRITVRYVQPHSYGTALQWETGPKQHTERLKDLARQNDVEITPYGIGSFSTEQALYEALNKDYVEPEQRHLTEPSTNLIMERTCAAISTRTRHGAMEEQT